MRARSARAYCASRAGATCQYPFGPDVRVYKVRGKVFALVPEAGPCSVGLKCDPVLARILRENHPAITPGYHLNKAHWNTVLLDGSVPTGLVRGLITQSYDRSGRAGVERRGAPVAGGGTPLICPYGMPIILLRVIDARQEVLS